MSRWANPRIASARTGSLLVLSSVEKRRPHLWRVNVLLGKEQGGPVTIYGVIVFDQAYQTEKVHFGVVAFSQRLISVDERP